MKVLIYLNIVFLLASFSCAIAMEQQVKFSSIPSDIWNIIISRHLIDENAKTEKEIFQNMDNLRATTKDAKKTIDDFVLKVGNKKNKSTYTYGDFKNDIMQEISKSSIEDMLKDYIDRKNKREPEGSYIGSLIFDALGVVKKYEAYNWLKYILRNNPAIKNDMQKALDRYLVGSYIERMADAPLQFKNEKQDVLKDSEVLLKLGANPNAVRMIDKEKLNLLSLLIRQFVYLGRPYNEEETQTFLNFVKLLLKYGADPIAAINYCKSLIRGEQGYIAYYGGYGEESTKTKLLGEIIELIEQFDKEKKRTLKNKYK